MGESGFCVDIYVRIKPLSADLAYAFLARYAPHWREQGTWGTVDLLDLLTKGLAGAPLDDATALYLHDKPGLPLAEGIEYAILAFDDVGGMTLGLSIAEESDPAPVLAELQRFTNSDTAFCATEWPPPRSETDWALGLEHNRR